MSREQARAGCGRLRPRVSLMKKSRQVSLRATRIVRWLLFPQPKCVPPLPCSRPCASCLSEPRRFGCDLNDTCEICCIDFQSHPRAIASLRPAPYSAGLPLCSNKNGPLRSSINMRPSCTGSTALAISINLRAAVLWIGEGAGSDKLQSLCFLTG